MFHVKHSSLSKTRIIKNQNFERHYTKNFYNSSKRHARLLLFSRFTSYNNQRTNVSRETFYKQPQNFRLRQKSEQPKKSKKSKNQCKNPQKASCPVSLPIVVGKPCSISARPEIAKAVEITLLKQPTLLFSAFRPAFRGFALIFELFIEFFRQKIAFYYNHSSKQHKTQLLPTASRFRQCFLILIQPQNLP